MGLSFFNQRRAREAEKAQPIEVEPTVEQVVEPIAEEIVEEITEEVEEASEEAPKPKKTDAEKIKKKK